MQRGTPLKMVITTMSINITTEEAEATVQLVATVERIAEEAEAEASAEATVAGTACTGAAMGQEGPTDALTAEAEAEACMMWISIH